MAKVMVKSDVFNFYLKSYGVDAKYLANKSAIPLEKVESWTKADSEIPLGQLRTLADIYKKHWGIFVLDEPKHSFKKPRDFRARSSRHRLTLASNLAFEEANRLIEYAKEFSIGNVDPSIADLKSSSVSIVTIATKVRMLLGVTTELQSTWRHDVDAWKYYYKKIEELGFLISVQELDEGVDGFIVIKDEATVIVISKGVKSVYRKTFTLLHELAHYIQRQSAACNTYELVHDVEAEKSANTFASNVLVPETMFNSQANVRMIASGEPATEEDYAAISKQFCISMSQAARRLYDNNLITRQTLENQLAKARQIYIEKEAAKKKKNQDAGGFDPKGHERSAINRVSVPLAASVLSSYSANNITPRDFASIMGVKVNLVGRIVTMLNERS
ncbi:MAG TPA: ImmA/IrrE family metallo-endopeptidase [Candidatus Saccharimonadales bacterium]